MNKKTIVVILLLCTALSMGCLEEEEQTYVQESVDKIKINETILEPEIITIKSVNTNDDNIVIKVRNEGNNSVDNLMVGYIEVKLNARENFFLNYYDIDNFDNSLTYDDMDMLINDTLIDGKTLYKYHEFSTDVDIGAYAYVTTSKDSDYIGKLESGEVYESSSIESGQFIDYSAYWNNQVKSCTVNYYKIVWSDNNGNIIIHDAW